MCGSGQGGLESCYRGSRIKHEKKALSLGEKIIDSLEYGALVSMTQGDGIIAIVVDRK